MSGYVTPGIWDESELAAEIAGIAAGDGPIVVGPWLSELGYELLYWIPFVTAICQRHQVDPARLTVLSRGGVASWYAGLADRYVELFDHCTADEFRLAAEARQARQAGSQKQFHVDDFDFDLLDRVGLSGARLLHPRLMYRAFHPYFAEHRPQAFLREHLRFTRITPPAHPVLDSLPASYAVVKFYTRPSFPADAANRALVEGYVSRLAERQPVVVLDHPYAVDDHGHFAIAPGPNVHHLGQHMTLPDNLALQTAVLSRATMFAGTYGGFCYLPMRLGKPAIGLMSQSDQVIGVHAAAIFGMAEALDGSLTLLQVEAFRHFADLWTKP
jgi:hypothetical protein